MTTICDKTEPICSRPTQARDACTTDKYIKCVLRACTALTRLKVQNTLRVRREFLHAHFDIIFARFYFCALPVFARNAQKFPPRENFHFYSNLLKTI